jgi:hypothetical protein
LDAKRSAVILSYLWLCKAYKYQHEHNLGPSKEETLKKFDESLCSLAQWLPTGNPTSDGRYLLLWEWRQRLKKLYGQALKLVNKYVGESKNMEGESRVSWNELVIVKKDLIKLIGVDLWDRYEQKWSTLKSSAASSSFNF